MNADSLINNELNSEHMSNVLSVETNEQENNDKKDELEKND